jgi:hypothetical protein
VTVLLAADHVDLYPPDAAEDSHGWALPDLAAPFWTGLGNLQLAAGRSDPAAGYGGGAGPFDPAQTASGELYLPPDAAAYDGAVAVVAGQGFVLSQVRLVADPLNPGAGASCLAASVSGLAGWPG